MLPADVSCVGCCVFFGDFNFTHLTEIFAVNFQNVIINLIGNFRLTTSCYLLAVERVFTDAVSDLEELQPNLFFQSARLLYENGCFVKPQVFDS